MRGPPPRHPDDQREQLPPVEGVIEHAGELKAGDRVVYPNQGVYLVVGTEEQEISGQKLVGVRMRRAEDGSAVLVPNGKVPTVGLRRVATTEQIEGVFHYLAAVFDDPELDWKVRHRDNADRLIAGGVLGVAEVVKGLHSLSRIRPLPTKEREQYDNARHLLVHEVAESLGVPPGLAEDYVDYALMPPTGTRFDLKPPPTPVMLPSRPKKKRPVVAAEGEGDGLDDLGLGDLGIDLGAADLEGALAAVGGEAVATAEGGEAAEGEGTEATGETGGEDAEEVPVPKPAGKAKPTPPRKPAKAAAAPRKPAAKPPARKAAKPATARKPAAKPARAAKGKAAGKGKKK